MITPANEPTCQDCGSPVSGLPSEGLCPVCLLSGVLARGEMGDLVPVAEDPAGLQWCGAYEIMGLLARGGMGVVFRARKAGLSREVALKMIATADLAGPDEVRRFRLEAELIAQLDHPNIVPVYDVGEDDGRPFFVMKLAEGGTLAQRLERTRLTPSEVAEMMLKVCRAVHFAHEHGVLHRDLKPANILLETNGEPLVSDFGLARLTQGAGGSQATAGGVGTPAYMAPEQALGSHAVTTASDVYGLGAVCYHLLTGQAPFTGETPLAVLRRAETEEPMDPRTLNAAVDRDLATICLKCLEKAPVRRYRSAAALADDLERWQRGEPVLARSAAWHERIWKAAKRRPAWAALVVAGIVGSGVLAIVLARGNMLLRAERNYAQQQAQAAKIGTERAESSERSMRLNVYAADMFLTRRALDDGHLGVARQTLGRHVPAAGAADLRGYEWYAMERQCKGDDLRVLPGHTAAVLAVGWSPDGKFMATGGRDGLLQIWHAADGTLAKQLPDQPKLSKLAELAMLASLPLRSPETTALLAPNDGVSVDDMRMRARASELGEISALAWSPDGLQLATGGVGSYVRIWNTSDWSYQGFLPVKGCVQLAFGAAGKKLVVAVNGTVSRRGEVRVYDLPALERSATFLNVANCFALADQPPVLATAEIGGALQLRDLNSNAIRASFPLGEDVTAMAFSSNGSRLALLHPRSGALWDAAEGRMLSGFSAPGEAFSCLAVTADGSSFAASGVGHGIHFFDGQNATPKYELRGHDDDLLVLGFSPDGKQLLSGSTDQTARQWSVSTGRAQGVQYAERGQLVAATLDGTALLGNTSDGSVHCWDGAGKCVFATGADAMRVGLGFSADGKRCATLQPKLGRIDWWGRDGASTGPPVGIPMPPETIYTTCSAKGWIMVAPRRSPVHLYDWETGQHQRELPMAPLKISRLLASPNGRWLLAFEWPRNVALCDLETGTWSDKRQISPETVGPMSFSADSTMLATGGNDNLVTVSDPFTGKVISSLRGHKTEIKALAFTADGRTLASSSSDGTIHLWHTPTWRELGPLHRGPLCPNLLFTPQGLVAEEYASRWFVIPGAMLGK